MAIDVEAEIRDLTFGFLTQQIKGVHKDLLAFQTRTEQRFDKIDGKFDKVDGRLDRIDKGVRALRGDMPEIVGAAMREVQRAQRPKSRKTP